jgi:1-acyl-sn-glycerol-3-phosphate acyltransferase
MLRSMCGLDVKGLEHVPAVGPFILAANHHNYIDAVVLGVTIPRHIHFLVMPRVYHASPLHPLLHRSLGSIPVNLERPDSGAISAPSASSRTAASSGSSRRGPSAARGDWYRGSRALP